MGGAAWPQERPGSLCFHFSAGSMNKMADGTNGKEMRVMLTCLGRIGGGRWWVSAPTTESETANARLVLLSYCSTELTPGKGDKGTDLGLLASLGQPSLVLLLRPSNTRTYPGAAAHTSEADTGTRRLEGQRTI